MNKIIAIVCILTIWSCSWELPANKPLFSIRSAWNFGGISNENASKTTFDNAGNIYVLGTFSGTLPTPTTKTSKGGQDVYLIKYNPERSLQWVVTVGSTGEENGNDISIDNSGNIYATGSFQNTSTILNSDGSEGKKLNSTGGKDIFIVKFTSLGKMVWATNAGGIRDDEGYGIAVDESENVYVTGSFVDTEISFFDAATNKNNLFKPTNKNVANTDVFTVKYSQSGEFKWTKEVNSPTSFTGSDVGVGIATDNTGAVYITGLSWGRRAPGTSEGSADIFIKKFDTNGVPVWDKAFGSIWDDMGTSICVSNGYVYITGGFGINSSQGQGNIPALNLVSSDNTDAFVLKMSSSDGNVVWTKGIGGNAADIGSDIAVDSKGNVFCIGSFESSTMSFKSPPFLPITLPNKGDKDIFIALLDKEGNFISAEGIGGSGKDEGSGLTFSEKDYSLLGLGTSNSNFSIGSTRLNTSGGSDILLFQFSPF